ncbi:MAG: T9SS type A sorting domain-containing protein [Bacteroidales bacterium]|nr:T9SS type A sorting domain-containing protein [Bacteroidales bacterium]
MRAQTNTFLSALLLLIGISTIAQDNALNLWVDHLPYSQTKAVAVTPNRVYVATPYSLFSLEESSENEINLERITKINGLSDTDIGDMAYNKVNDVLVVAYSNTNIDILKDGEFINIPDIKRYSIPGNKTINKIMFIENDAYLACGFGIVVLDLDRVEIKDTYYIGPEGSYLNVRDLAFDEANQMIYAATDEGVYAADKNASNLAHYEFWNRLSGFDNETGAFNAIAVYNNEVVFNYTDNDANTVNDQLYHYDGQTFEPFQSEDLTFNEVYDLESAFGKLSISFRYNIDVFKGGFEVFDRIYSYGSEISNTVSASQTVFEDAKTLWVADKHSGLIKNTGIWTNEQFILNGPGSTDVFNMDCKGTDVWVATGGYNSNGSAAGRNKGVYRYQNKEWTTYDHYEVDAFDTIYDFVSVAIDPGNAEHVFVGTWNDGLIEFLNGEIVKIHNKENSTLQGHLSAPDYVQISGLAFDSQRNLWVANSNAEKILHVLTVDGEWKGFNLGNSSSGSYTQNLEIDNQGNKWLLVPRSHRIFVFDDNGTPLIEGDDDNVVLSKSNLPGESKIFSLAFDDDGEAWIGSDQGPGVIYSPENIFATGVSLSSNHILINRNDGSGQADILLENEQINVIAVDPANRKWIGTENAGVFLMSDDGTKEIHHFTEDNSPLLSNTISAITLDDEGFVYLGTPDGIMAFHSDAIPPSKTNDDIEIFPNPVRPGYTGNISIQKLKKDSDIKIVDLSGKLVFTGRAEGGQALWDGRNMNNVQVASGLYLVFVSDEDGTSTNVGKILFLK